MPRAAADSTNSADSAGSADFYTVEPCASSRAYEVRLKNGKIDVDRAEKSGIGSVIAKTPVVLVSKFNGHAISIYASGRIMIKGMEKKEEALALAKKLIRKLKESGAIEAIAGSPAAGSAQVKK